MIEFKSMSVESADARMLLNELNTTLISIIGHNGTKYVHYEEFAEERAVFIIGYVDGEPMCCAGLRRADDTTAEIKRVFARKNKIGLATMLMAEMERIAREYGYTRVLLECRDRNTHAVEFYHRVGYTECAKYGVFVNEDDAVCMDKYL